MKDPNPPVENSLVGGFVMTRHNDRKAPLQVEAPRSDELSPIDDPAGAERRLAEGPMGKKGGWPKSRNRRTKLAVMGIPSAVLDSGSPAYARCVRLASAYRKIRARELCVAHGYVSSGASALLASAAMALASSRYLYEQAASGGENVFNNLKTASRLADSARQNELAAWELCAREAVARKRSEQQNSGLPWLVSDDDSGYAKKKPGPKKKVIELQLPPVGQPLDGFVANAKLDDDA